MRLAYVCTENMTVPPVNGGAVQTHIAGILPYVRRLHEVTVFCTRTDKLPNIEESEGVIYVRLPGPSEQEYMKNVQSAVAGARFDLIHIFNRPTWVVPFANVAQGACINLRIHNAMFEPDKITPESARECIERLSAIDTVSDFMAQKICDRYSQAFFKLRTIYTGVDLERFVPPWLPRGEELRRRARQRLGLHDEPLVLFVGRLDQSKGVHILLPAMKRVRETFPDAVLLVVGSRWFGVTEKTDYIAGLESEAGALGSCVRFTGYMPALEIERAFAAADVFVCASQWEEPLARVHFEAMATGLPLVTTARGGNPEVVYDGVNGRVVRDYQNPEAFAREITSLLGNPDERRALGERGRALAEARFSWYRTAAEVLDVYDRVTRSGRLRRQG